MQKKSAAPKKASKTITRPSYALESVDNALRLLQMLRDVGALRLKDAAEELGTAPSTAHRLLSMLVYRGFAVQDEKRRYHPGPAMGVGPAQQGWTRELTELCRPHMEALAILTGETINLVIRVGSQARFLYSAESESMLRVGDRQGQVLAAELTAGGRILLAELPRQTLEQLYLRPPEEPHIDPRPIAGYGWTAGSPPGNSRCFSPSSRRPAGWGSPSTWSRPRRGSPHSVSPSATGADGRSRRSRPRCRSHGTASI